MLAWRALMLTGQPPVKSKGGRMMALINYRLRVTLNDARQLTGRFLAFDVHMNMVLAESACRVAPCSD